jgi:AraC-like DNA-binding protein
MFVSVVIVRGILAELRQRGVSADELFGGTSLSEDYLADMRAMVHIDEFEHLVTRAMLLSKNPGLGLSVGMNAPETMFQILAHLALAVPTLRAAYGLIERYSSLLVDDLRLALTQIGDRAEFKFGFHGAIGEDTARFGVECLAAVCLRIGYRHFAPDAKPLAMRFRHAEPAYSERYRAAFGCEVLFEQADNAIVSDAELLDLKQRHADLAMERVLRDAAERMLDEMKNQVGYAQRLKALLRHEPDLCNLDVQRLARELGVTHRVLRRRLAAENTSLSKLVEETRLDIARAELRKPHGTIKEAAARLGYSEASAFHRAFKRWTGLTPSEYQDAERARQS